MSSNQIVKKGRKLPEQYSTKENPVLKIATGETKNKYTQVYLSFLQYYLYTCI